MSGRFGADELLGCYARGVFPMADGRDDPRLFLISPEMRGILPLDSFHIPRRLARTVRADRFEIRLDCDFEQVLDQCAAATPDRPDTWINRPIRHLYAQLHERGAAHSIECWQEGALVGGLYGVRLGGAFFGESMFSRATDASKVALVHLVALLRSSGFVLLDTQFQTKHLAQFGTCEIPRNAYLAQLTAALRVQPGFPLSARWPQHWPMTGQMALAHCSGQ